ncbi:unnamed protein product [Effrenium voratum]|nr:unnamed protein product [Effrenium voratum]
MLNPRGLTPRPRKKGFDQPSFVVEDYDGNLLTLRELEAKDILSPGCELRRLRIQSLSQAEPAPRFVRPRTDIVSRFVSKDAYAVRYAQVSGTKCVYQMPLAGARCRLSERVRDMVATVVTCGGLCPGLNAVIRELVMMLAQYGVHKIYGIRGGYKGVVKPEMWMELTPDNVQDINSMGGTILVSDRGNPTEEEQVQVLMDMGVRAHFIIGGDGTHRGAHECADLMVAKNWNCSVVGIPKTIDNDIPMLDCTFGFDTACMEAERAIKAGYVEATCNANCVGLVKLMGRHSGFIALHAGLAARHADIVMLPEMEISLEKVLRHILELMQRLGCSPSRRVARSKGHCLVVVAEGCGDTLLKSSGEVDGGSPIWPFFLRCHAAAVRRFALNARRPAAAARGLSELWAAPFCIGLAAERRNGKAADVSPKVQHRLNQLLLLPRSFWDAASGVVLCKLTAGGGAGFGPQDLAGLAWAFAKVSTSGGPLMALPAQAGCSACLSPRGPSNMARWSATVLHRGAPPFGAAAAYNMTEPAPQGTANLVWALAKASHVRAAAIGVLGRLAQTRVEGPGPQEPANTAWGFRVLEPAGQSPWDAAGSAARLMVKRLDAQCLANLA